MKMFDTFKHDDEFDVKLTLDKEIAFLTIYWNSRSCQHIPYFFILFPKRMRSTSLRLLLLTGCLLLMTKIHWVSLSLLVLSEPLLALFCFGINEMSPIATTPWRVWVVRVCRCDWYNKCISSYDCRVWNCLT